MSISCLAEFSAAGSALAASTHTAITQKLKELMVDYGKTNRKEYVKMTQAWDVLHRKVGYPNYPRFSYLNAGFRTK